MGKAISCECECCCITVILEDECITKALVVFQVQHPIAIGPQHILDRTNWQGGQGALVIGGFHDHLVRSHAIHAIKQTIALAVKVALDAERREFVGDYADGPARCIWAAAVTSIGQDFRRRFRLVPQAERAKTLALHTHAFAHKVGRPLSAISRDNDPATCNRVLT